MHRINHSENIIDIKKSPKLRRLSSRLKKRKMLNINSLEWETIRTNWPTTTQRDYPTKATTIHRSQPPEDPNRAHQPVRSVHTERKSREKRTRSAKNELCQVFRQAHQSSSATNRKWNQGTGRQSRLMGQDCCRLQTNSSCSRKMMMMMILIHNSNT